MASRSSARFWVFFLMLALAAGGGFGYWQSQQQKLPQGIFAANGRLEATEVQIATKSAGRLAEVLVREGDRVKAGQLLARLDTRTLEAQREQAKAQVLQAKQNLASAGAQVLQAQQTQVSAEAQVRLRQSEQTLAGRELARTRELIRRDFASRQQLDQLEAQHDTSAAAVSAAQAQLAATAATVTAAQAQQAAAAAAISAAEAQVAQLSSEIDEASLRAPLDGVVQMRLAEPGEVLAAGGRVLLLVDPLDQYMNIYLSALLAGGLRQGDEARILLDALPNRALPAEVAFVASQAQFTPKAVETRDEREKLVFRVKLRLKDPAAVAEAKPGMPGLGHVRAAGVAWPANLQ